MTRTIPSLLLVATLTFVSCRSGEPEPPPAAPAPSPALSEEVDYEPAYPADVSSEGLSEEDVSQQQAPHPHGDEGHAHDDEGHAHDDGSHAHEDDADDPEH